MKTVINGKDVIIKFKYSDYVKIGKYPSRTSTLFAKEPGGTDAFHQTSVTNDGSQQFSFANERKHVVEEFLKELNLDRQARTRIWKDFLSQCPTTVRHVSLHTEAIKKKPESK